jgi:hypothetical protein
MADCVRIRAVDSGGCRAADDAISLVRRGMGNMQRAATPNAVRASRSHCIVRVAVEGVEQLRPRLSRTTTAHLSLMLVAGGEAAAASSSDSKDLQPSHASPGPSRLIRLINEVRCSAQNSLKGAPACMWRSRIRRRVISLEALNTGY